MSKNKVTTTNDKEPLKRKAPKMKMVLNPDNDEVRVDFIRGKEYLLDTFGTNSSDFANDIINRTANILAAQNPDPLGLDLNPLLAHFNGLNCQDEIEALIGSHLYCLNILIIKFLTNANAREQTFEGSDANVERACKLLRAFNSQLEQLNKYRNKGEQRMTVEHVNINKGGQAVFGNISSKRGVDESK